MTRVTKRDDVELALGSALMARDCFFMLQNVSWCASMDLVPLLPTTEAGELRARR